MPEPDAPYRRQPRPAEQPLLLPNITVANTLFLSLTSPWIDGLLATVAGRGPPFEISRTQFEHIAVQSIDAKIPIPRFGPGDEFDVDLVRLGLDVDVEDAFVNCLRGFGAKPVAIDQHPRGGQAWPAGIACRRFPGANAQVPSSASQLFDMARQVRPAGESVFPRDRRLGVGQSESARRRLLAVMPFAAGRCSKMVATAAGSLD